MPGLVTILCHAECLGAWTFFWAPCRSTWPFETTSGEAFAAGDTDIFGAKPVTLGFHCRLMSRSDMCSLRWNMNGRDCMEATIEHLVWLLYPKFAHYTFTITAFRIVKMRLGERGMTLAASH
eukprot:3659532-Amphidinium_carterae.1